MQKGDDRKSIFSKIAAISAYFNEIPRKQGLAGHQIGLDGQKI